MYLNKKSFVQLPLASDSAAVLSGEQTLSTAIFIAQILRETHNRIFKGLMSSGSSKYFAGKTMRKLA